MSQKGLAPILIILLIAVAIGGYLIYSGSYFNQTKIADEQAPQSYSQENLTILALKDGDLYSIQSNNLSDQKLTSGGGFYTSNQYDYWVSPDKTKLITKQNKTLLLITKDGSKPILQTELKGDVQDIVWRNDGSALLIWQTLKYMEAPSAGLPILSEVLTYDLETGVLTSIKQINGWGGVAVWDKDSNTIGYTVGGGEGGAFGEYHTLNLTTKNEKNYKTPWVNPGISPDLKEFIVFQDYNEQGNLNDKQIKIYSILSPDKPLRTFPSPTKDFYTCSAEITSRSNPIKCLGIGKSFWYVEYVEKESRIKSFNTSTGEISEVTTIPGTLLDLTRDQKFALILEKTGSNQSEYKIYNLTNGESKSLGFTEYGTTQPKGLPNDSNKFWTHEALGFIY